MLMKRILLLLPVAFMMFGQSTLLRAQCHGTVHFDASVNAAGASTFNITTANPNELILITYNGWNGPGTGPVTVDGNPATHINTANIANSATAEVYAYSAPAAGLHTIVCTENGYNNPYYLNMAAAFYATGACSPITIASLTSSIKDTAGPLGGTITGKITTSIAGTYVYGSFTCNNGLSGPFVDSWTGATFLAQWHVNNGVDVSHAYVAEGAPGVYTISASCSSGPVLGGGGLDLVLVAIPPPPCGVNVVAATTKNESCFGGSNGSVNSTASAGTPPYTYNWAPSGGTNASATGLSAGTYTITVRDSNGCTATAATVITQPTAITAVTSTTPTNCLANTGSASVTASGGTPAYTYNWAPGGQTNATATGLSAGTYTVTVTDANGCTATAGATVVNSGSLTVTISGIINEKCNGESIGSATANPSGGTAPYTYAWAPAGGTNATATGLTAGSYTVTVKDKNGCVGTALASITQPALLAVSITVTNVKCNGGATGSSTANPSGGTPAYKYIWAPGGQTNATATGLTVGSYTVTVTDANGCTATAAATITQPAAALTVATSTIPTSCSFSNGSATVTASGGTPAYKYVWVPGGQTNATATGLSAGNYTVTVTDANGCTATALAVVGSIGGVTVTVSGIVNEKCNGEAIGSATANPLGGTPPYTYNWTPGGQTNATATGLTAGSYTITVKDFNGCTATAIANITQPAAITAPTSTTPSACLSNTGTASVTAGGGTPAYTYNWAPGGQTNSTATGLSAGTYTVTVTDANGCTATAAATVANAGGLTVSITSVTNIKCNGGATGSETATPVGGTPPYTYNWAPGGQTNATATGLTAGTYTVLVTDKNGCSAAASATITQPAAALSATTGGIVNVKCNGGATGSATVTAAGGTPAYTYNWVPGGQTNATATGLTAGTYTVTVTDNHGCTATATAAITQPTALSAAASANPTICTGSTGSASVTAAGGTPAYTYNWAPGGQTNAMATGLSAGSYTVTVTDKNGCTATASATVTSISGGLTAGISSVTNIKCNGAATGSATATAAGGTLPYTYNWAPGGQTNATATGLTAGTYTVTVHDKNGCVATASATLTQPPLIVVSVSGTPEKCNGGSTGTASSTTTGGTPAYTYNWTPSGGTNANATGLSAGTYTLTVTDANGCTKTASISITQPLALNITIANTPVKCNGGNTGTASSTVTGGTPAYTYNWTPSGGTNANATGLSAGTYTLTVTDANGCSQSASTTITQPPVLLVNVSNTPVKCGGGNTGTASSTVTGGTPAYTYNWTPSGGTNANATGLSAGTYTLTVTDNNGCTVTASTTITQPPVLTLTLSNTPVKCNGGNSATASSTVTGGTPAYTYNWTPSGGTNANATGLSAGTYTLTVTDKNGCTITASTTITQPPLLTAAASSSPSTCLGSNGSASVTAAGGTPAYTYNWTPGGQTNATATGLSSGTYTVTVTDNNGCTTTAQTTVTSIGGPSVSASSTPVKCNGGNTGTASATGSGGTLPYTYNWTPSGGTNATATGLSAGTYTITLTDKNGCVATAGVTVTQPPVLTLAVSNTSVKCNGGSTGTASSTATGGTPAYTYNWAPSGGTNANATGLSAGTYTLTVTDKNGCTATAATTITQPATLTDGISAFTNVTCNGGNNGSATVTVAGGTAPYAYNWTPAGGTNATATGLTAGSYTVTVNDANGCTASAMVTLTQPPGMSVTPSSALICSGDTVVLTASGAVSYTWSPGTGLNTTIGPVVKASPATTTSYTVTGISGGCVYTDVVVVTVKPTPVITLVPPSANLCSGDSVVIRAYGANSYTWAPPAGLSNIVGLVVTAFPNVTTTYTVTGSSNGCSATQTITVTVNPTPTVTVNPANPAPSCSGDSVALSASGATSYTWSPATGLSSISGPNVKAAPGITTIYSVTGSNGPCSATATVVVTVNPTPTVVVTPPSASICTGGSGVALTASGASTYTWAPAAGLSAITGSSVVANPTVTTTYTVTGTSGSCSSTQTVTITVNSTPTVVVTPSPASVCSGDSVTLTASGASSYTWSPATGLSAITGSIVKASPAITTSYTVTGTNGACTSTTVVIVTVNPTPVVTVIPPSATICSGAPGITLNAGGASTYAWAPSGGLSSNSGPVVVASPTLTTTYTVTGTGRDGCTGTATITVTVDSAVAASVSGKDTICAGDSTTLTATGGGTYSWSTGATTSSVTVRPPGSIQYSVTVTKGACSSTVSIRVVVRDCNMGVNEISWADNINIFPNPTTGSVQVQCDIPDGEYIMSVTDVLGRVLSSEKLNVDGKNTFYLNLGSYSSGLYILTLKGMNSVTEKKIMLNK